MVQVVIVVPFNNPMYSDVMWCDDTPTLPAAVCAGAYVAPVERAGSGQAIPTSVSWTHVGTVP